MNITFGPKTRQYPGGLLMVDDAYICFPNFSGRGDKFNKEGDRNFGLRILDQETLDRLQADKNEFGDSWNVKIKAPRNEGEEPFMFMKVKVKFNGRGPKVYLISGNNRIELDEETIGMLDDIDIERIDMDIRPYDDQMPSGKSFRAAYLDGMEVVQRVDRFTARYEAEE